MFTGLVLECGVCVSATLTGASGRRLRLRATHERFRSVRLGDSIAVNGACLTVVGIEAHGSGFDLDFDVSEETLARTNLAEISGPGARVHLEASLRLGDEMGGHVVTGHVDARGRIGQSRPQGDYVLWEVVLEGEARRRVAPYLVEKGSWAVDGVSLTVNEVLDEPDRTIVRMTLIPHTLVVTRFGGLAPGALVNVEADLLAKYATRALRFKP